MDENKTYNDLSDNGKWAYDKFPKLCTKSMITAMLKAGKIEQWEYDFIIAKPSK